jgi:hypothetical protein
MKPVLIVENSNNSLINESKNGKKDYTMSGVFTEFDIKNRNERVYTADKFLPALNELNSRISDLGVVYGEYDHPDVFDTSLSRASHTIRKAEYNKESNCIQGEIKLLNTHWGKEAKALVDDECPIFVSSRAAGITESDGSVTLKKLFTYDIVADPGFASAKMSMNSINESLGFKNDTKTNFRIYEMSDESKINELFNMNKDYVTKDQLTDYSKYLVEQVAVVKKQVNTAITKGGVEPKKLEQLLEYYEELNNSSSKVVEYLDYLSEKLQIVVNENVELKKTQSNIIKHNDYLAENLEKSISYSEYIAENLDKNIDYSEYIAESLDKNIAYSEYIAENVDKNIAYSEYIAESLDKNIAYSEYIAENLDSNIAYSEYIAENLDENISYSEYLAENLDKSVEYQSLIAESLKSSKLNESVDVEVPAFEHFFPEVHGEEDCEEEECEEPLEFDSEKHELDFLKGTPTDDSKPQIEYDSIGDNDEKEEEKEVEGYNLDPLTPEEITEIKAEIEAEQAAEEAAKVKLEEDTEDVSEEVEVEINIEEAEINISSESTEDCEEEEKEENCEDDEDCEEPVELIDAPIEAPIEMKELEESTKQEDCEDDEDCEDEKKSNDATEVVEEDLTESINKLIAEAKKRKVSETNDLNFLKFLNKSQVDSYYSLSDGDQELVKLHINESNYFSSKDVLKLISESLSQRNESTEDRVLRLMPSETTKVWEQLNESSKKSILSQAKLYPQELMMTESQIDNFWNTRKFKAEETTKKLISHQDIIQEDTLSDNEMTSILEKFKNL